MREVRLVDSVGSSVEDVQKLVFDDGDVLEVTRIQKGDGKDILCVPTQTSCNMGCTFCHLTGSGVRAQNLSSERIVGLVRRSLEERGPVERELLVSFMGAGEPLLNVPGMMGAAREVAGLDGYSSVRFAVSTILPSRAPFEKLVDEVVGSGLRFKLHWSLHAPFEERRASLMPSATPVRAAVRMVEEWMDRTGLPAEVHYALMDGVNDRDEDVRALSEELGRRAVVKLLRFAEHGRDPGLVGSSRTDEFRAKLEAAGLRTECYSPPGRDIGASCGQFLLDRYVS